jgi:hypothetical protein
MNTGELLNFIEIAGCASYALLPFINRKRKRARWGTLTVLFNGLFGLVVASVDLALRESWLMVSTHAHYFIDAYLRSAGGIFLGVSLALIFSGQLFGARREDKANSN